ncbi:hypothetical protein B0H19DRAFT_1255805 [Mycena capillaripes]|nr:hypothetical protein B0H19DRAFT_1255805 [Mycena capillaripes]
MTHRLRSGVGLFTVGFILNRKQITTIAQQAFSSDFIASHLDEPVMAFKWHIRQHNCEALATVDPQRFLVAVHFYPWVIDTSTKPPSEVAGIPQDRREMWEENYGKHVPGTCTEVSRRYPQSNGSPFFLPDYVEGVVNTHNLWQLLEPIAAVNS